MSTSSNSTPPAAGAHKSTVAESTPEASRRVLIGLIHLAENESPVDSSEVARLRDELDAVEREIAAGKAAHTPTPWNLHRAYDGEPFSVTGEDTPEFIAASLYVAKDDRIIAEVVYRSRDCGYPNVTDYAEFKANAAFIVAACNAHEADQERIQRLEALAKAAAALDCFTPSACDAVKQLARAVLQK